MVKNVTVAKFDNDGNLKVKKSSQDFDAEEMYRYPKELISLIPKASKNLLFSSFSSVQKMPFPKCASWSSIFIINRFRNQPEKKCAVFV